MDELIEIFGMNYNVNNAMYLASMRGYKYTIVLYSVHSAINGDQGYYKQLWSIHV